MEGLNKEGTRNSNPKSLLPSQNCSRKLKARLSSPPSTSPSSISIRPLILEIEPDLGASRSPFSFAPPHCRPTPNLPRSRLEPRSTWLATLPARSSSGFFRGIYYFETSSCDWMISLFFTGYTRPPRPDSNTFMKTVASSSVLLKPFSRIQDVKKDRFHLFNIAFEPVITSGGRPRSPKTRKTRYQSRLKMFTTMYRNPSVITT